MSTLIRLENRIADLFEQEMHIEVPDASTDLFETGIVDSLAFATLVLHLEQGFSLKISIDDLELENFRSIARIAEFIADRTRNETAHVSG